MRVYIGDKNTFLDHGPHTYTLRYRTDRQLGFFDTHDELYWNVTGNGWEFLIDSATATVYLPDTIPIDRVTHEGYTGLQGSRNQKGFRSYISDGEQAVRFATIDQLAPKQGLTVVVTFPKGHVEATNPLWVLLSDPTLIAVAVGGVLGYYLFAWLLVGKDPSRSAIVPQWEPPMALSPAALRYVRQMGYDSTCFTVALLSLAVKKWITIEQRGKGYVLKKQPESEERGIRSEGETTVMAKLLRSWKSIHLKNRNHKRINNAIKGLKAHLKSEFEGQWLRDQIEGFRVYLSTAEADRIDFDTRKATAAAGQAPDKTIELFEAYLPYAVALGVENQWAEQFDDIIKAAALDPDADGRGGYHPVWYHGSSFDASRIGSAMSGLTHGVTGAISSASVAPGSSSGSSGFGGGGGFSGGGGGGGGGGGW